MAFSTAKVRGSSPLWRAKQKYLSRRRDILLRFVKNDRLVFHGGRFDKGSFLAYSSFLNIRLARSSGVTSLYLKYA